LDELETTFDKWLYVLKHLPKLQERPLKLQERVFGKLFELAQIGKFNREEMTKYEESLKVYWDMNAVIETAKDDAFDEGKIEGKIEGKLEGKMDVARKLIEEKLTDDFIEKITGLSLAEIKNLRG
jgi:predicted transposase/invertase (TIGR01784 family)